MLVGLTWLIAPTVPSRAGLVPPVEPAAADGFAAEPPAPHLRLTFAGAPAPDLAEGVRRLARVAAR